MSGRLTGEHQRQDTALSNSNSACNTAGFWMAALGDSTARLTLISLMFEWSAPFHDLLKGGCVKALGAGFGIRCQRAEFCKAKTQCQLQNEASRQCSAINAIASGCSGRSSRRGWRVLYSFRAVVTDKASKELVGDDPLTKTRIPCQGISRR